MNEEIQEKWTVDDGNLENGLPFTIRFREDLPEEKEIKKLRMLVVISWSFESADGNGMPNEEELDQMENFENLIDEALVEKGTARLMTVFTGEGVREWQFYTDDEEFFMKKFNAAMEGREILPLDIEVFEDENWEAYKNYTGLGIEE
jgi:hypothetical protein